MDLIESSIQAPSELYSHINPKASTSPRYGFRAATHRRLVCGAWIRPRAPAFNFPTGAGFDLIDHGIAWTDYWVIGPTHLDRIDVSTGAVQTWVQTQGDSWLWFVGLDGQGNPLVEVGQGAAAPGNVSWR